jgi:hypothetical protein
MLSTCRRSSDCVEGKMYRAVLHLNGEMLAGGVEVLGS